MNKKMIKLAPVAQESDNSLDGGVAEDKTVISATTDEAIESDGENSTLSHATPAKTPDETPKPAPKKISLPIHDDYELSQVMLTSVEKQAKISLPGLVRGVRYTAKKICGKPFWKMLAPGDKIVAGICMARLVATHRLPLIEAGTNSSNSKTYELR